MRRPVSGRDRPELGAVSPKFIISHPAVTCTIPATRRVDHLEENMSALRGRMPDAKLRARMARYAETV
jgi:aryl-alcohol dehydrogenase-like predicted oxidoreductase